MYVYNYPDVNTEFKLHYSGAVGVMFFNDDSGEKIWTDALERGTYTPIPVKNPYDID